MPQLHIENALIGVLHPSVHHCISGRSVATRNAWNSPSALTLGESVPPSSGEMSAAATIKPLAHPFTRADADIVLRSCDNIDFHVHKQILLLSSPTFETLFALPQPPPSITDSSETTGDGKPIIYMHGEDADMLDATLRECYPGMESRAWKELSAVVKVLAMAEKYEMQGITEKVGTFVQVQFLKKEPLRVYAIARRYRLAQVAEAAAKESLLHPPLTTNDCPKELQDISAAAYHQLIAYRAQCVDVFDQVLQDIWKTCPPQAGVKCPKQSSKTGTGSGVTSSCVKFSDKRYLLMPKLQKEMYKDCSLWLVDHIERMREGFAKKVSAEEARSLPLYRRTVNAIHAAKLDCACGVSGPPNLLLFGDILAQKLDVELKKTPPVVRVVFFQLLRSRAPSSLFVLHMSLAEANPPTTHPFTRADANVILRSSDNVDFYVHKWILVLASPTFETMFSFPQPPAAPSGSSEYTQDGKPIIYMSGEDADLLDAVLRECYPNVSSRAAQKLETLARVLAVTEKYDMQGIQEKMSVLLQAQFLREEPLRVFAIAYRYKLFRIAELAAQESLLHPAKPLGCPTEFQCVSAAAYFELLRYRAACVKVFEDILAQWRSDVWEEKHPSWVKCPGPSKVDSTTIGCLRLGRSHVAALHVSEWRRKAYKDCSIWFMGHIERIREAFCDAVAGSTITSLALYTETVATIHSASLDCRCGIFGPQQLLKFNAALRRKVEEKLKWVRFQISPDGSIECGYHEPAEPSSSSDSSSDSDGSSEDSDG
ncbi:hypothetical protein NM688_g8856 [Phlebia brevispora]|uniref:Uncharacterized protein n=1 Tax=Phlebia brevispora TaxID=194682 RepID=A0ACC1RNF8_9APHY|nr:hypothetical protein NM688_g8856 [Phlebia brevispora]